MTDEFSHGGLKQRFAGMQPMCMGTITLAKVPLGVIIAALFTRGNDSLAAGSRFPRLPDEAFNCLSMKKAAAMQSC